MCVPIMDTKLDVDTQHSSEQEHFAPEYRDRLRTWLVKMIDSATIPGLCWENDEKTIFRMPWKHAGRQDYNLEEDSKIFMAWAKHSGRYREGIDKPEPIVWKTRLRCALNKMPDIKELPSRSRLDISEPYRVYQLLPPIHKASQIRRRFYNRSQSQDLNQLKTYEALQHSKLDSSSQNGNTRSKNLADSSIANEMSHVTRTSPLSGVSSVTSPAFWLSPSVNMSLKAPMSTDMLHASGSPSVDALNQLQNFAQGRYPLMTSLHHPFVSFPSTTIPSYFPNTSPSFEALKQLALTNQSSVNGLVGKISARAREAEKYKHQVKVSSHSGNGELDDLYSDATNRSDHHETNLRKSPIEIESSDADSTRHSESSSGSLTFTDKSRLYAPELHPLYVRLEESQKRIEALEQDLKKSRTAHAREREAREQLEDEKEKMKSRLERMSDGLRILATHMQQPHDEYFALNKNGKVPHFRNGKQVTLPYSNIRSSSESPVKREVLADSQLSAKINRAYNSLESIPKSAVKVPSKSDISYMKNQNGKRCASPLDLSVPSPKKATDENRNPCEVKSASILSNSSSPLRSLSSDDKRICSPYSSSSGSPDSIGRSRSLSPLSGHILRQHHQRPVQVL